MRISKLNSEGYYDETPYLALQNIGCPNNKGRNDPRHPPLSVKSSQSKVHTGVWRSHTQEHNAQGNSPKSQGNPTKYYTKTEEKSMENIKMTSQRVEHIALAACVPTNYQRTTSNSQVTDIIDEFDEARLGTLTVSLRDGNYHIVDGLHRSKALKALGYTHALCIVLTGLTYEQEAALFRRQNDNKRNILTFEDFAAGLEERDEMCIRINNIVKANSFQVGKGESFFKLASVKALQTIVRDYGYGVLDDTLCLLANTWSSIPRASHYESLLGVAEFVYRYGIADFAERMKDKFSVVFYDYSEAMRVRGSIGSTTSRKKFCRILVEHYNKGFAHNNKKRLVWEDK